MSTPASRATVAGLAVAAAMAASWFVPALAPILIWPLLLVVPGWVVIGLVRPRIDLAGRLGLAVVVSVVLATHLAYWLGLATGGYHRGTAFAIAGVVGLSVPLAAWLGWRPSAVIIGRRAWPGLAIAGLAALVVGTTLGAGLWRITEVGVFSGGSNWSDLGVHLSIAETVNAGANFPPEVPYFAGEPLVYHWFADFHAAILARTADAFSIPAMVVQSTVLAAALALLVFSLARRLLRSTEAVPVAAIAATLVVIGGGLGYVRLIGDVAAGAGSAFELVRLHSYDNQWLTDWPFFRIPSVMGTGLLVHRATTAGLPILVGAVLLLVAGLPTARQRASGWRDRPWLIAGAGTLGALLAPFHFFFFPLIPLLALAWVLAGGRLVDREAPRNAVAFVAPYALAVPFVVAPLLQAGGSGWLRLVSVWPSAPVADGAAPVVFFYLTNLGVPFVLALAALVAARVPHRAFLAAWVIGLFAIPNLVQVSVIDFDMNKVFQAMWIGVAMSAAWLMRRWPWPAVALALALSVPSPLLVAAWTATSDNLVLDAGEMAAAAWVATETPPDAVFVTDGRVNALTDSAGRRRLTTFGPYIANLGFAPDERIAHVHEIYCGGDPERAAALMRQYGATYVVDGGRPQPCASPVDFATGARFELAHPGSPRIWRLRD